MHGNGAADLRHLAAVHQFIWDRQNTARLIAAGGVEHGKSHYVFFAGTHAAWLAGLWALGWAARSSRSGSSRSRC